MKMSPVFNFDSVLCVVADNILRCSFSMDNTISSLFGKVAGVCVVAIFVMDIWVVVVVVVGVVAVVVVVVVVEVVEVVVVVGGTVIGTLPTFLRPAWRSADIIQGGTPQTHNTALDRRDQW